MINNQEDLLFVNYNTLSVNVEFCMERIGGAEADYQIKAADRRYLYHYLYLHIFNLTFYLISFILKLCVYNGNIIIIYLNYEHYSIIVMQMFANVTITITFLAS